MRVDVLECTLAQNKLPAVGVLSARLRCVRQCRCAQQACEPDERGRAPDARDALNQAIKLRLTGRLVPAVARSQVLVNRITCISRRLADLYRVTGSILWDSTHEDARLTREFRITEL